MKGRVPKPVEQKMREGNPGQRKLPAPLRLRVGGVLKPDDLPPAASELWDELVPILDNANVLNRVDAAALQALCIQWERAEQARRAIKTEGLFTLGSAGQLAEHPALQVERQAHQLMLRFAEQFGITPVARARIAAAAAVVNASMADELSQELDLGLDEEEE